MNPITLRFCQVIGSPRLVGKKCQQRFAGRFLVGFVVNNIFLRKAIANSLQIFVTDVPRGEYQSLRGQLGSNHAVSQGQLQHFTGIVGYKPAKRGIALHIIYARRSKDATPDHDHRTLAAAISELGHEAAQYPLGILLGCRACGWRPHIRNG